MKRVGDSRGFTIVETLIFLAVSGALLVGAMLMLSGQQGRTEFRQAVGDTQGRIDDVANDVATGYYSVVPNIQCFSGGSPAVPSFNVVIGKEKGTSSACTFVGRVIQFGVVTADKTNTYTAAGFRLVGGAAPTSLGQSMPTVSTRTDMIESNTLLSGLKVYSAFYQDVVGGTKTPISGVAIVSRLGGGGGAPVPGTSAIDIVPLPGAINAAQAAFITAANDKLRCVDLASCAAGTVAVKNPRGGISVCFDSGGSRQHAILRFGVDGTVATVVTVRDGQSSADTECA